MFIEWWILVLLVIGYVWKVGSLALEVDSLRRQRGDLISKQYALADQHADELYELERRQAQEIVALREQISNLRYGSD